MDLAELLEHVPPLLNACICDDILAMRRLRLVGKDCSRIALLALRSYTLTLKGGVRDTNIKGTVLLRQANLKNLTVCLDVSGGYLR